MPDTQRIRVLVLYGGRSVHRHFRMAGEALGEVGGYGSQVIDDDDSHTHIGLQMP